MPNSPVILYVEDDPASITIMKAIIEKIMKIPSLTVFQGSDRFMEKVIALKAQPDVFILDIHMKPLDGYELLTMLRADSRFRHSKIIALTASVMGEEVDRLKSNGFDGAISKPLSIRQFPGLLERILQGEPVWFIS
jgi:CheY-like chemotaxis protein